MKNLVFVSILFSILFSGKNVLIAKETDSFSKEDLMKPILSQTILSQNSEYDFDSLLEAGFDLMERESLGGWLKLGLSESEVLEQLGEPSQKGEDVFWGAIGMYVQKWEYRDRGIILQMESEKIGQPKQILMIEISAPCNLKTNAEIGIGSDKESVIQAYHNYQDNSYGGDEFFTAGTAYGGLIFSFENGKVSNIFIGAAAE